VKKGINPIFSSCSLSVVIMFAVTPLFSSINAYALTGRPETVSTLNFTSPTISNMTGPNYTSTTDAIDTSMNNIMSDNMDSLLNQTILPLIEKPDSLINRMTPDNESQEKTEREIVEREIVQPILTSDSHMVIANNGQTQNATMDDDTMIDTTNQGNDPIPFSDNQTVLLQFEDTTDPYVVNKLQRLENMAEERALMENATRTVAKSVQDSNNMLIRDLTELTSSINGSSSPSTIQFATSRGVKELDNLTDRISTMQKANNKIIHDVLDLKSVNKVSSFYFSPPIISSIVAAIVSFTIVILFSRMCKIGSGIKFNDLRFKKKYR
jgi:hypothetical protein